MALVAFAAIMTLAGCPGSTGSLTTPEILTPANGGLMIAGSTTLVWMSAGSTQAVYDVYFGTVAAPTAVYQTVTGITNISVVTAASSTYYWKVVAKETADSTSGISSSVGSFTTAAVTSGSQAATTPYGCFPANNGTIETQYITELRWNITQDPDIVIPTDEGTIYLTEDFDMDTIYFDVYFGETSTAPADVSALPLISHNMTISESYPDGAQTHIPTVKSFAINDTVLHTIGLDKFENATTYYWGIVVTDQNGTIVKGPAWKFTTALTNTPPIPSLTSPAMGAVEVVNYDQLTWTVAQDYDKDILWCDVYISVGNADGTLPTTATISNIRAHSEASGTLSFECALPSTLVPDAFYTWKVVVKDSNDAGAFMSSNESATSQFRTSSNYYANAFSVNETFSDTYDITTVPTILNPTPTASCTIEYGIGNPYPSLKIASGATISSAPVNYFDQASLSLDVRVINADTRADLRIQDSNSAACLGYLQIGYGNPQSINVRCQASPYGTPTPTTLAGKYWLLWGSPTLKYFVWYSIGGSPATISPPAGYTAAQGIQVAMAGADPLLATAIATSTQSTLNSVKDSFNNRVFNVTIDATQQVLTIQNRLYVGDVTLAQQGTTGWPTLADSFQRLTSAGSTISHLYALRYDETYEDYSLYSVGDFTFGTWTHVKLQLMGDYTFTVTCGSATPVAGIKLGKATTTLGNTLTTYKMADCFSVENTGVSGANLWVDNIVFTIDSTTWSRSLK